MDRKRNNFPMYFDKLSTGFQEQCHCEESATKQSRDIGLVRVLTRLLRRGLLAMTGLGTLFRS